MVPRHPDLVGAHPRSRWSWDPLAAVARGDWRTSRTVARQRIKIWERHEEVAILFYLSLSPLGDVLWYMCSSKSELETMTTCVVLVAKSHDCHAIDYVIRRVEYLIPCM